MGVSCLFFLLLSISLRVRQQLSSASLAHGTPVTAHLPCPKASARSVMVSWGVFVSQRKRGGAHCLASWVLLLPDVRVEDGVVRGNVDLATPILPGPPNRCNGAGLRVNQSSATALTPPPFPSRR